MANGVSLNWGGFDKVMAGAVKKMVNKKLLMATIGETLVSGTIKRFADEEDPQGQKWKKSRRAAEEGGQTLTETARLRKSIDYAATPDKVMVGSNVTYARIHQFGGTIKPKKGKFLKFNGKDGNPVFVKEVNMPARPYIGISTADMKEVRATIAEFLSGAFKP